MSGATPCQRGWPRVRWCGGWVSVHAVPRDVGHLGIRRGHDTAELDELIIEDA